MNLSSQNRHILSISQLTARIKSLLEKSFPFVWISGEISNFRVPSSGHFYFTLKDNQSQIQAVMFKGQNRNLKFLPEHGMQVLGFGRISLYEPRGSYQIILEYLEPEGVGALQVAFEQLKGKLEEEGLFDSTHKKELPFLPRRLTLITSPTGAVVHDMLTIVERRFPNLQIDILPVKVQGDAAAQQIVEAFELVEKRDCADAIILARGGGSLEDLQAFNTELVARAIHACRTPVISAIGHETDYTITDFVADVRAPTPSAAAELVVPIKQELIASITQYHQALQKLFAQAIESKTQRLRDLRRRLKDPGRIIEDARLKVDDYTERLYRVFSAGLILSREKLARRQDNLARFNPKLRLEQYKEKLELNIHNLQLYMKYILVKTVSQHRETDARLKTLDPEATLQRGYSITRTGSDGRIVMDSDRVGNGQLLDIIVARGRMRARVEKEKG
ncbi:MAG: exodeoxyribonuclease VII large subunit [Desulfobacterales bacterium]|nr:exodeoxyribonuclease VII large subunit [Desulfobacterales bacterium]